MFTIPEASRALGTTETHVRRLVFERRIRFVKVGKFVRLPQSGVDEFLKANTVTPRQEVGL